MKSEVSQDGSAENSKKTYVKPTLVEYGSIAKLTQGGGSVGADPVAMQSACL